MKLRPGSPKKSEIVPQLFLPVQKAGHSTCEITLSPSDSTLGVFQAVANAAFRQLIENCARTGASRPESLHQMRVALRKLNALMKLFTEFASGPRSKSLAREMRWIGRELSLAREIDVFISDVILALKQKYPDDANITLLHRVYRREQKREYQRVKALIASDRFRIFVLAAAEWIETADGQNDGAGSGGPAKEIVAQRLSVLKKKMKCRGRLEDMDHASLHKLRLRAKRMRYVIEFTEGLFPGDSAGKHMKQMLDGLRGLQACLGSINDLAIGKGLFDKLAHEAKEFRSAKGQAARSRLSLLIFGDYPRQIRKLLRKSAKAYDQFERAKPFWK